MKNTSKLILPGAMAFAALVGIGSSAAITAISAHAESASTTTTTSDSNDTSTTLHDPHQGGHKGSNGTVETLLTGDAATKVTEAAKAAVPGAIVERVETDAEGAAYEAHMTKSDGSKVTVKFDSSYKVTSTEAGRM